jgi:hypothetical protein
VLPNVCTAVPLGLIAEIASSAPARAKVNEVGATPVIKKVPLYLLEPVTLAELVTDWNPIFALTLLNEKVVGLGTSEIVYVPLNTVSIPVIVTC